MGLRLNLDETDRRFMLQELERDETEGLLYPSPRLTPVGAGDYLRLLRQAAAEHDDDWLAAELRVPGRLQTHEVTHRKGVPYRKAVPINASETLAEGEFNRLFIRGQCLRALAAGQTEVEIFRAKSVTTARVESEARIGIHIDADQLLQDLRNNVGINTALRVPGGPNSGISARVLA